MELVSPVGELPITLGVLMGTEDVPIFVAMAIYFSYSWLS